MSHELIDRPKAGFAIPVGHWIRTSLKDWAEELSEQALEKHGKFNTEVVRKNLETTHFGKI